MVAGTSPTTFASDQPVTREQIAVILTQYMFHVLKMERTWTPADLSTFPDGAQVSGWAKEAMQDEAVQADRVVVMDGGNILTDGDPRTVFAQVELLKRHKLDVPQATELIYRLNAAGCSISGTPLDEDECVKAIAEYLKLG